MENEVNYLRKQVALKEGYVAETQKLLLDIYQNPKSYNGQNGFEFKEHLRICLNRFKASLKDCVMQLTNIQQGLDQFRHHFKR